jgi:signal transduction histidine kinase
VTSAPPLVRATATATAAYQRPRLRSVPRPVWDAAPAVIIAALLVFAAASQPPGGSIPALGYAAAALSGLVLAARRRFPVAALVTAAICVVVYQAAGFDLPPAALFFAVYAATRSGHRTAAGVTLGALLVAIPPAATVGVGARPLGAALGEAALGLGWLVAAGVAGEALRQAEGRAAAAERTREEAALRRAADERLRIARELHDSLTHQISIIKVQSGVAVHLARKRGEEVPPALLTIQDAGREAARELRATLGALRGDAPHDGHGLDHVEGLVDGARSALVDATLTIDGPRRDLTAAVDRAAYRIVQESLTNVARHAGPATARVRIAYGPGALTVRVEDDGRAAPGSDPVPGVGLLGMRERVTALGGRLHAGPRGEGGFAVRAELPVEPAP